MKNRLYKIENTLSTKIGEKNILVEELKTLNNELAFLKNEHNNHIQAKEIVINIAKEVQKQLEVCINEIVTTVLAIFEDVYKFQISFEEKRGKTEASIFLIKDGEKVDPMTECGGGIVDIISFALRIALWNIQIPRSTNTIILDEPFRFLSLDKQEKIGEILTQLSEKLGLQFIIVTHNKELMAIKAKIFNITIEEGKSYVSN